MSEIIPERYHTYKAVVDWHKPPGRQPSPAQGQEIVVEVAWMMEEEDMFPGEFAFLVQQPTGFPYWIPQRDLLIVEAL